MNEEYSLPSSFKSINSILKHSAKNGRDNVVKSQLVVWLYNIQRSNTNQNSILEYVRLSFTPSHQFYSTPLEEKSAPVPKIVR